jgi:hypothetical protein
MFKYTLSTAGVVANSTWRKIEGFLKVIPDFQIFVTAPRAF